MKDVTNSKTQKQTFSKYCSLTLRCASLRGVKLRSVHPIAESSDPNFSKTVRCTSHQGIKFRNVHDKAESNCTRWSQNQNLWKSMVAFKGTIRRNLFRGEHIYHERQDLKTVFWFLIWLRSVMHTVESNFVNFVIEYLNEIET